jgi:hypothetical protein
MLGNRAVQRMLCAHVIQAKLAVNQPNNECEREADRTAGQVMGMDLPDGNRHPWDSHRRNSLLQPKFAGCGEEQAQRKTHDGEAPVTSGRDPRAASLHPDAYATESGSSTHSPAYGVRPAIVFRSEQLTPGGMAGLSLLGYKPGCVARRVNSPTAQWGRRGNVESFRSNAIAVPPFRFSRAESMVMREQKLPDYHTPETFTLVNTKKLNPDGAFTSQVLSLISRTWTQKSAYGGPQVAQHFVDALESSEHFVKIAHQLDEFHAKKGNPEILVTMGFTGTEFLTRGTPFQWKEEDAVQVAPHSNIIFIDFPRSGNLFGSEPEQIAAFVSAIIHESNHAYDSIKTISGGGLAGELEEEQRTRKGEMKGMEQIKARAKDRDLIKEADKRIKQIGEGGLTKRKIAEDLVSGGKATYLESYYITQAIGEFTSQKERLAEKPGMSVSRVVTDLSHLETFTDRDFERYTYNTQSVILFSSPKTTRPSGDSPGTHSPIRRGNDLLLLDILDRPYTLQQLAELKPPRFTDEESFVYYHILLLKVYQIKIQVAKAWEEFAKAPDPTKRAKTIERNARESLGRSRGYAEIKD